MPSDQRAHELSVYRSLGSRTENGYHLFDGGGRQVHRNRFLSLAHGSTAEAADLPDHRGISELASRNAET